MFNTVKAPTRATKVSYNKGIRLQESDNPYTPVLAEELSVFYGSPSRPYDTKSRSDVNAKVLCDHLNSKFPELVHGFKVMSSQSPFDIYCLETRTLIEIKSVKGNKKKLVSNASIYPDSLTGKYAIQASALPSDVPADVLEEKFDVLVVCISQLAGIVQNFAIVDGSYWGVTEEHYLGCRILFGDLRDHKVAILESLPQTKFIVDYLSGIFGSGIDLNFRKLIMITNPIGRLGTLGHWDLAR